MYGWRNQIEKFYLGPIPLDLYFFLSCKSLYCYNVLQYIYCLSKFVASPLVTKVSFYVFGKDIFFTQLV